MNAFSSKFLSDNRKSAIHNPKWLGLSVITFMLVVIGSVAQAQQAKKVPRIGILISGSASGTMNRIDAFREGLRELGYVERQSVALEIRWAEGKRERLPALADELLRLKTDCIVTGSSPATQATKKAITTIPIVMANDDDPVAEGHVVSLARPGGNITGLASIYTELMGKRLELLREVVPKASRVAVLFRAANPANVRRFKETEGVARAMGVALQPLEVQSASDFDSALRAASTGRATALIVFADALTNSHRTQIVELAARNRLPAIYPEPEFVPAGGLMSYAPNVPDQFRRAAIYVDKILKGAKPADLPVEQPTKFEFIINLKAAKQIGLTIPPEVLYRADKIIK